MSARLLVLAVVACSGCSFDILQEPVSDVEVSWQITAGGDDVACDSVDAWLVRVTFDAPAGHRYADWFPCDDGLGIARFLPIDDYTVTAAALGPDGIELSRSAAELVDISEDASEMTVPRFRIRFDSARPTELPL